ncbi:MAG: ACT domain-containing protein [Clostridiales bacterium]|jgi:chorismate mutase|nr:ACT domain-containing protein [Clostridiales bacterium]
MNEKKLVIVETGALPEIFLKVLEAKRLMEAGRCKTVQEAASEVGISRSAFYKYKDSIFDFFENTRGRSITVAMDLEDTPGVLSHVLNVIAVNGANILTINQTIPLNRIANLTITVDTRTSDVSSIMDMLGGISGVQNLKVLARE